MGWCNLVNFDIPRVNPERNYWFLRTQGGQYYHDFLIGEFIAIGWDKFVDISHITEYPEQYIIEHISALYPKERRPGHVYNQIMRFVREMKVGDVVIIPSHKSQMLSIGIVESDVYIGAFCRMTDSIASENDAHFS